MTDTKQVSTTFAANLLADMPAVKLWATTGACSLAAHILLNEVGVLFEVTVSRPEDGISDEVKKLNPKKKVPVLQLDDQVITENVAILTAIAHLAPERNLLGKTDLDKLRVYEYMAFLSSTLHAQAFGGFFRPGRFSDDEYTFISIREKGKKAIFECFEVIESGLKGTYAVGDQLTVVDPYLYVFWRWGSARLTDMEERYPKYTALIKELGKHDSVRRTLEKEGIEGFLVEG